MKADFFATIGQPTRQSRRGAIALLAAILLVVFLAFCAFSLDMGYMLNVRTELQRAVDAAAFAATGTLVESRAAAVAAGRQYVRTNMGPRHPMKNRDIDVEIGSWNRHARVFEHNQRPFDAVRVTARRENMPLCFANVLGTSRFNMAATAVATYRPRDIMLVLDYSGSMNTNNKIGALRDAVSLFISTMQEARGQDRVGFAAYSTTGVLAQKLTFDLDQVERAIRARGAGGWTNMGSGMELGLTELLEERRQAAQSLMVVMTDGIANRPLHRDPLQYARDEATRCAAAEVPIVSISFTADSDQEIMAELAQIAGGVHFHVEGSVAQQERELEDVFREVAARRPLRLVE